MSNGAYAPFAWLALLLCWIGAGASFLKSRHRKVLLDTQTCSEHLKRFGGIEIAHDEYIRRLELAVARECRFD